MPRRKGMDSLTAAVVDARDLLVRRTEEMTKVYVPGRFMTREVDPRTMRKYLLGITPEQMAEIAARNPDQAEEYAAKINRYEAEIASQPTLPAQDSFAPTFDDEE